MIVSENKLKHELQDNFQDARYCGLSLVKIYLKNPRYVVGLIEEHKVSPQCASFFAFYDEQLKQILTSKSQVRQQQINSIVNEYVSLTWVRGITWDTFDNYIKNRIENYSELKMSYEQNKKEELAASSKPRNKIENRSFAPTSSSYAQRRRDLCADIKNAVFHCTYDRHILNFEAIISIKESPLKGNAAALYSCPKCNKNFLYTNTLLNKDYLKLSNGKTYTVLRKTEIKPVSLENSNRQNNKNESSANKIFSISKTRKGSCYYYFQKCPEFCWKEKCNHKRLETVNLNIKDTTYVVKQCPSCGTFYVSKGLYNRHPEMFNCLSQIQSSSMSRNSRYSSVGRISQSHSWVEQKISTADFIVKGNTFQCIHKGHYVESIVAAVPVITGDGDIAYKKYPAGYCKQCKTYFIRESVFDSIKQHGIIACRVQEELVYRNRNKSGFGDLAQQSILMEYGYNVSRLRNLSDETRHRILSLVMDNNVLSASGIINYLEFFINQRKNQKKDFGAAISKWESDIRFVKNYHRSSSREVNVNSIKYKKVMKNNIH